MNKSRYKGRTIVVKYSGRLELTDVLYRILRIYIEAREREVTMMGIKAGDGRFDEQRR